jgi:hypothetical protein
MQELALMHEADQVPAAMDPAQVQLQQMSEAMQTMAMMLRATAETIEALRKQVRLLEKVTPGQAAAINAAIRGRAAQLCEMYKVPGKEKTVAALIRKDMKLAFGAAAVRDLPRCDYENALQQLQLWDDYKAMKRLRGGATR